MSGLTVTVKGSQSVANRLRRLWPPARKKLRAHVATTAQEIVAQARGLANNASIASQIMAVYDDDGFTARVESRHPASAFREHGTRPHIIRPKRKKMLKFDVPRLKGGASRGGSGDRTTFIKPNRRGGYTIFTTRVDHPGTTARPFLQPAVEAARRRFVDGVEGALT